MKKKFKCSVRRNYDVLEDDFEWEFYAQDQRDMLLFLVADLGGIHAQSEDEAKSKASLFLAQELGSDWTVDQFLNSGVELWKDNVTLYEIQDIEEIPIIRERA